MRVRCWLRKIWWVRLLSALTDISRKADRTGGPSAGRCRSRWTAFLEIMRTPLRGCVLDASGGCKGRARPRREGGRGQADLARGRRPLLQVVVRRLAGDDHVVRVRLAEPGVADADEAGAGPQRLEVAAAAVAHAAPQTADELEDHIGDRALVGDPPLDPLRHQLAGVFHVALEVAVGRALLHCGERAHPAHGLVAPALEEEALARALLRSRQERTDHDGARPG